MLAAEEWQKYEEDYLQYGVELEPEVEPEPQKGPEKKRKKKKAASSYRVTAGGRLAILSLIAIIAFCAALFIGFQAWKSNINYHIYELTQQEKELSGDIDNLNVDLNSNNQLDKIETYAQQHLGMTYPMQEQYVYVVKLKGTSEVNSYIASLAASQRGAAIQKDITAAEAASRLLS
ncbi:MAG: cell division protein FtsL [Anaerovoracaceae bacterium]|nr:cell division protein FtsL [Bacillota bacterium]MDY2670177.1 cell division protein FtsL [Anaerovoracaceae bacterium]